MSQRRKPKTRIDNERDRLLTAVWKLTDDFWMWSLSDLADEAGLSVFTVYKLYDGTTRDCRSSTLLKLIEATGLHIELFGKNAKAKKALLKLVA